MPFALLEAGTCNALDEAVAAAGRAFAVRCAVGVIPGSMICLLVGDKLRVGRRVRDLPMKGVWVYFVLTFLVSLSCCL